MTEKRFTCENYGLNCLKCPLWNRYSNYCTKFKIWSETHTENKRYFERMYEEEYYIFDSHTISEKEFDEKLEYEGYKAFEDSLTGEEILDLLNKNRQYTIKDMIDDYIQSITIKVDELPLYGDDKLIYQLPNKLQYIYFEEKWVCIGKAEE